MTLDASCTLYGYQDETIMHVLHDCPRQREVWKAVVPGDRLPAFFTAPRD